MAANPNQSRFFLAIVLSLGILLIWGFLFPPPKPNKNANTETANISQQNTASTPAPAIAQQNQLDPAQVSAPDNTPNRVITVTTPLYDAKIDSRGGVVTSWILKKNKVGADEKPLYSIAGTKDNPLPLELVSAEGIKRGEVPLKLITEDANLNAVLNGRNYQVNGIEGDTVALNDGESRKIEFVLRDEANQIEAVKTLTFYGDQYVSDLQTRLTKNNQPVQNTKLQIGASIGDQGIKSYNYYAIESEGVAVVNGNTERHLANSFLGKNSTDPNGGRLALSGETSWAGVGDTYFAMAAIPAQPANNLEFQATKYEAQLSEPKSVGMFGWITGDKTDKETRHLISALIPIQTDGVATTKIYTGTKDHFLISSVSRDISQNIGRTVELERFLNFSWMGSVIRPIAVPILSVLSELSKVTHNYGVSILVFTFLFYSLLFPMRWYQSKSFKKAAKNAPKMKELQDRMKEYQAKGIPADDPRMRELQIEQLKMTKDAVPIGGCLPLLLQFPLLIALYTAITISLDFRQAPFLWLPDLSAADPYHILEFLFAGSMALAMAFTPTAAAVTPEQQMQQKMMTYFMPVMMLWVMWSAPAGLLVYWLAGNVIGFFQQLLINRLTKAPDEPPTGTTSTTTTDRPMTKKERMKTSLSTS